MSYAGDVKVMPIPELRGMPPIPEDRERLYSAASYCAQYGIPLEDAQEIVEACTSHPQAERMILALFKAKADLKKKAMLLDGDGQDLSIEEKRTANRLLRDLGMDTLYDVEDEGEAEASEKGA